MGSKPLSDLADDHEPPRRLDAGSVSAALSLVGAEVWVKHENLQQTGAFKVRGGINLVSRLGADERDRRQSPA